jgi:hypothetical protein
MKEELLVRSDTGKFRTSGMMLLWVVSALVHQIIGLLGIPVLSAFVLFTFGSTAEALHLSFTAHSASAILTQIPGYPVQACLGLILGLILGRYAQRKVIVWVWVLPLILFVSVMLFPPLYGSAAFGPYYPPDAHHVPSLAERLSWLIVLIPSAAYATGAKLARQYVRNIVAPK